MSANNPPPEQSLDIDMPTPIDYGSARAKSGLPWTIDNTESELFAKLELPALIRTDSFESSGKMLEFPTPLGTDELNHFVVFTVYHGIESIMTADELGEWSEAQTQQTMNGAVTALVAGGTAMYVTPKILNRIAEMSTNLKKLPKIGPVAAILTGIAAGYYGWKLGSESEFNLTPGQIEQIKKFDEIALLIKQQAEDQATQEFGDPNATGRLTRIGKAMYRHSDTIALYMPQKIQALSLLEYEQQDMSFIQNIINDWTGLASKAAMVKGPGFADQISSMLGTNSNMGAAIQGAFRMDPNPRKQLMFREPVSRKFEFNFNLSPRSPEESAKAYEIIQTFKKHAYPKLSKAMGKGAFYK